MLDKLIMTYTWAMAISKLSILALYTSINPSRGFGYLIYSTAAGILAYQAAFTVMFEGPYKPTNPDPAIQIQFQNSAVAQAGLNIATDIIIIALPIPMIHSLHMPLRQKCLIGALLGLASWYVINSIVRRVCIFDP